MTEPVRCEQEGRIAVLTPNRPETRNALDDDVADALVAACERLGRETFVTTSPLFSTNAHPNSAGRKAHS